MNNDATAVREMILFSRLGKNSTGKEQQRKKAREEKIWGNAESTEIRR